MAVPYNYIYDSKKQKVTKKIQEIKNICALEGIAYFIEETDVSEEVYLKFNKNGLCFKRIYSYDEFVNVDETGLMLTVCSKFMKAPIYRYRFNPKALCDQRVVSIPEIENVIFNGPATIVLWANGDKTVVKCGPDDVFDKEKGLAMAISKYIMGTNKTKSNFNDIFKKWC